MVSLRTAYKESATSNNNTTVQLFQCLSTVQNLLQHIHLQVVGCPARNIWAINSENIEPLKAKQIRSTTKQKQAPNRKDSNKDVYFGFAVSQPMCIPCKPVWELSLLKNQIQTL